MGVKDWKLKYIKRNPNSTLGSKFTLICRLDCVLPLISRCNWIDAISYRRNNFVERIDESAIPSNQIEGKEGESGSEAMCAIIATLFSCVGHPPKFLPTYHEWTGPKLGSLCHGMFTARPTMTYGWRKNRQC